MQLLCSRPTVQDPAVNISVDRKPYTCTMIGYFVALVVIILLHYLYTRIQEPGNLPPGPMPLPLVGNVLHMLSSMSNVYLALEKLAKTYGNIMTVYINGQRTVVVSSGEVAREVLVVRKDDFAGRPYSFSADYASRGCKDIAFNDFCPTLILQRKVMHTALRLYRPKLEAAVCHEADKLVSIVKDLDGKPFDPYRPLSLAVLNFICGMVFGCHFEYDDPEFLEVVQFNEQIARSFAAISAIDAFPFLIHFPLEQSKFLKESKCNRDKFLERELEKHMESFDADNIRDITDASIKALRDSEDEDSKYRNLMTRDHVLMTLGDMFSAGNETAVTTLRWLLAHLIRNPDVQDKLHVELDRVVGRDPKKAPTLKDRENLPYLEASILETMRMASPVPLAIPHKTTRDTTVQGYSIPKNTTVILNLWAIHHNSDDWQKHDVFDPSRFLGEDGKISSAKTRNLLPFGAGRRVCIGETDSKTEMFLIASRLLHQFRLERAGALPEMTGDLGIVNFPKPYKIRGLPRL